MLIMSISIVFDLSEKLNELLANGAPWSEIFGIYYVNFFLFYGVQFSYLLNFISVIWFTSKMANNTEIVPVLSAGVSFNRFLRPYIISSAILVLLTMVMYNYVLPASNKMRIDFENTYYRVANSERNFKAQVGENEILFFDSYNGETKIVNNFNLQHWDENQRMVYWFIARSAVGDSTNKNWHFEDYSIRYFTKFNDSIVFNNECDTMLNFGISEIVFRSNVIEAMNNSELEAFIEQQQEKGSEKVPLFLLEKHRRWAAPFAIFVLSIIGVSLSSQKKRGGLGMNIALGLILAVLYIFSMQITSVAATNVGLAPFLAVWIPNVIFSVIAFYLYKRAPK